MSFIVNGISIPSDLKYSTLEARSDGVWIDGKKFNPKDHGIEVSGPISFHFTGCEIGNVSCTTGSITCTDSSIKGSVSTNAGSIRVTGDVGGNVSTNAGSITIGGSVGGSASSSHGSVRHGGVPSSSPRFVRPSSVISEVVMDSIGPQVTVHSGIPIQVGSFVQTFGSSTKNTKK